MGDSTVGANRITRADHRCPEVVAARAFSGAMIKHALLTPWVTEL
jgi:hypothetical protein